MEDAYALLIQHMPKKNYLQKIGKNKEEVNLSKALLNAVAGELGDTSEEAGLKLYRKYISQTTLSSELDNLSCLDRFDDANLEDIFQYLYNAEHNSHPPMHFDIHKMEDVNRLARLCNITLVIYFRSSLKEVSLEKPFDGLEILHDYRVTQTFIRPRQCHVLVTAHQEMYNYGHFNLDFALRKPVSFIDMKFSWIENVICFTDALSRLLVIKDATDSSHRSDTVLFTPVIPENLKATSILQFQMKADAVSQFLKRDDTLIVGYVRRIFSGDLKSLTRRNGRLKYHFVTLARLRLTPMSTESSSSSAWEEMPMSGIASLKKIKTVIVVFAGSTKMGILKDTIAKSFLQKMQFSCNTDSWADHNNSRTRALIGSRLNMDEQRSLFNLRLSRKLEQKKKEKEESKKRLREYAKRMKTSPDYDYAGLSMAQRYTLMNQQEDQEKELLPMNWSNKDSESPGTSADNKRGSKNSAVHKQFASNSKKRVQSKICKCSSCKDSKDYECNMQDRGPEELITVPLDVSDLLEILGMDSPENLQIIETLCEMSVAAFDIESRTVPTDHLPSNSNFKYSFIDRMASAEYTESVQKPLMLSHMDYLNRHYQVGSTSEDSWNTEITLTVKDDTEKSIYAMFQEYWDKHLLPRHQEIVKRKREIAKPIIAVLQQFSEANTNFCLNYFSLETKKSTTTEHQTASGATPIVGNYCIKEISETDSDNDDIDDKQESVRKISSRHAPFASVASKIYRHSLFGQLTFKLERLIKDFTVFSFYGSGYDHVLLLSYLIPHLYESKQSPKAEKRGNKVTSISTRSGIVFRDIAKLLAPGTNLRNFGKLFNLEMTKAHFPFNILDSVEKLNLPRLPTDLKIWQADVLVPSGGGNTAKRESILKELLENMTEAHRLFDQAGCQNVGDYLRVYLRLDVEVLYRATQEWRRHLNEVVKIDFIESRKFTISSLSNLAGGKSLVERRHLGQFFVNNCQTYRLLKRGMRGYIYS